MCAGQFYIEGDLPLQMSSLWYAAVALRGLLKGQCIHPPRGFYQEQDVEQRGDVG